MTRQPLVGAATGPEDPPGATARAGQVLGGTRNAGYFPGEPFGLGCRPATMQRPPGT
ncbi:hypothetical protein [Streptomyces sp. NPDC001880]